MSFSSINAFNASKGLGGTSRTNTATFNPASSQPIDAAQPPAGMVGPPKELAPRAMGSSYTIGAGMQGTGRNMAMIDAPNNQGVVTGRTQMADVGQQAPALSAAEMQDPNNAALIGFQLAAGQDRAPSASTNPGARSDVPQGQGYMSAAAGKGQQGSQAMAAQQAPSQLAGTTVQQTASRGMPIVHPNLRYGI